MNQTFKKSCAQKLPIPLIIAHWKEKNEKMPAFSALFLTYRAPYFNLSDYRADSEKLGGKASKVIFEARKRNL
jgi:hypothetical protein